MVDIEAVRRRHVARHWHRWDAIVDGFRRCSCLSLKPIVVEGPADARHLPGEMARLDGGDLLAEEVLHYRYRVPMVVSDDITVEKHVQFPGLYLVRVFESRAPRDRAQAIQVDFHEVDWPRVVRLIEELGAEPKKLIAELREGRSKR